MTRDELIELLSTDADLRYAVHVAAGRAEREASFGERGKVIDTDSERWKIGLAKQHAEWEIGVGRQPAPKAVA